MLLVRAQMPLVQGLRRGPSRWDYRTDRSMKGACVMAVDILIFRAAGSLRSLARVMSIGSASTFW